jgi:nitrate/nitrite transporter NarK
MIKKLNNNRWLIMFSLIFAGEMIFSLPFHIARFFRPTLLYAFNLTNTQLGDVVFPYGILAMLSYFPGGLLSDRFSAKKLMSFSLFATAAAGIYMSFIPGISGLYLLFAWWGITTIFLFWSPMIKATREWGGNKSQGKAFGLLDGGRGLAAATVSSLAVFILARSFGSNIDQLSDDQRIAAIRSVILLYTVSTALAGILIWFFVPENKPNTSQNSHKGSNILKLIRTKNLWLQAIVVVSAYSAYKGLDYYSLYAVDFLKMNELEASSFVSNASYLRPLGAIIAGVLVDKYSGKKIISLSFIILAIAYSILSLISPNQDVSLIIFSNLLVSFFGVYALRGVYFALVEETKIPTNLTGTAVGIISVIGYTPDVFFNSLAGRLLDNSPGLSGYHHFYYVLFASSLIGFTATIYLGIKKSK